MIQELSGTWAGRVPRLGQKLAWSHLEVAEGEWWRGFTANLLNTRIDHGVGPLRHLVVNVVSLVAIGPYVENRLGRWRFAFLMAVGGTAAYGWLVFPVVETYFADGTSGTVYAVLGGATVLAVLRPPRTRFGWVALGVVAIVGMAGLFRTRPTTTHIHAAGLVAGVLITLLLIASRRDRLWLVPVAMAAVAVVVAPAVRARVLDRDDPRVAARIELDNAGTALAALDEQPVVAHYREGAVVAPGRWRAEVRWAADLATTSDEVWVTSPPMGTVTRLALDGAVLSRSYAGPEAVELTIDGDTVWVVSTSSGDLWRLDRSSMRLLDTIRTGARPHGVAASPDAVWVADEVTTTVARVSKADGTVSRVDIGVRTFEVVAAPDGDSVWFTAESEAIGLDSWTGAVLRRVALPGSYISEVAMAPDGRLWIADIEGRRLVAIDAKDGRVVDEVAVGLFEPVDVAVGGTHIWALDTSHGQVARVDLAR